MFRSMTAYGRAHVSGSGAQFLIEIHSVNRKSLDISINLPKELLVFDMDFRKRLSQEVKRGFITVRITKEDGRGGESTLIPDFEALKTLQQSWETCAQKLGYDPKQAIPFHLLLSYGMSQNGVGETPPDETLKEELMRGFEKALEQFISMREKEGKSLMADIGPRLDEIEEALNGIASRAQAAPEKFREKLDKRLEELGLKEAEGDERLMRELVVFSEKVDVTEEMTRLRSHVEQFRGLLSAEKRRVGREMDFLIQEMNREVNTIAAKSQDLEITQTILGIKTEQEKIREQVQNIE